MNEERTAVVKRTDGSTIEYPVTAQVGTPAAVRYVENDGILHLVLHHLLTEALTARTRLAERESDARREIDVLQAPSVDRDDARRQRHEHRADSW